MSESKLEGENFDKWLSQSEVAARAAGIACNDAFVAAMNKAVRRKREKVLAGTFVDDTPNYGARRIYGDVPMSTCGSPAAMCMEAAHAHGGAETMK